MENLALIDSFAEFKDDKNIDRVTLMGIIEDVFRNMIIKRYGSDDNFDIIVNPDKGDLEIWRNRIVVKDGEVEDENAEITYSNAIKIEPDFEVGEEVSEEVHLIDFGRRAILSLRQNLISRIQEHDNTDLYNRYKELVGEIISGEVHHIRNREVIIIDDMDNEVILPKDQQIRSDFFRKGDTIRGVVKEVQLKGMKPRIVLSRTSPKFLERLFEQEIPEVADGLIIVKRVERIPGEKAKVAVESYDERIDPVGACVGMKGSRIHGIVRELGNENIDVINYTSNKTLFISRALSPAKVSSITLDEDNNRAEVFLKPDQVSLAIGRGGSNIRLAGAISGYEIDVYRDVDDTEDVALTEFVDEIDGWIIDELKNIGCDTAKSVLELSATELVKRTDLEEETIKEIQAVLKSEFED
ncbi:transcription termination factor NusA [Flavobacteriales bacterium]|jgi:N utilization substance protein A|nr:transcription termination factor NusA [Flavobacteriales bacterium]MDB2622024.1 transcription termination factor NusA [Flavobacteriales bacterium]